MPRQPFLPTFSHLQYAVGAKVINDRPEFSSAIGQCIAMWSQVDNEMGNLLGILLGTGSEAAMEVFLEIRQSAKQVAALRAASKFSLTGDEKLFFETLMTLYKSLEKQRNDLAHGCFGVAANDPDALLWVHIKHHVHFQTEVIKNQAEGIQMPEPHKRLLENMYVYRIKDLEALQDEMEQFWDAIFRFNGYLRDMTDKGRISHFARVQKLPYINAELDNQRSKYNNA